MSKPRITNGRSWQFDAPVVSLCFSKVGVAAFALGDGTLHFVTPDTEPKRVQVHDGAILSLCEHPKKGFLTGGDDGKLVCTKPDGESEALIAKSSKWIEHIAVSAETDLIACTQGKNALILSKDAPASYPHATTASGIAFDPKGRRIAVAHYNGASLWWAKAASQAPTALTWKGSHIGATWSPDGRFLVTSMQENALHGWRIEDAADMRMSGYPSKVKSWAWDRRGKILYTSGSNRVIGWVFSGRNGPMGKEPLELGPDREGLILAVAAHPELDLIAAGTNDGAVWFEWLGEPGAQFAMLDGGRISALGFSPDGSHLAIGTEEGLIALVEAA